MRLAEVARTVIATTFSFLPIPYPLEYRYRTDENQHHRYRGHHPQHDRARSDGENQERAPRAGFIACDDTNTCGDERCSDDERGEDCGGSPRKAFLLVPED